MSSSSPRLRVCASRSCNCAAKARSSSIVHVSYWPEAGMALARLVVAVVCMATCLVRNRPGKRQVPCQLGGALGAALALLGGCVHVDAPAPRELSPAELRAVTGALALPPN